MSAAEERAEAAREAFETYVLALADPYREKVLSLARRWVNEECAVIERDCGREMQEMRAEIAHNVMGGW
jgi:hypothetical protein